MESAAAGTVKTQIPARLDRLPWTRFHWLVVYALGFVWILDGLEVTIVGALGSRLQEKGALGLSAFQIGAAGSIYIAGACVGALFFGYLTDRLGRKKLFMITLGVYLTATVATAFTSSFLTFAICRFFTGAGIGGEYSAINSAIDELIPARVRGWTDLAINGSFWVGTMAGATLTLLLLNTSIFATDIGWRLAFGLGAVLGLGILYVRRNLPESPRWLMTHGRVNEAEKIVSEIEERVKRDAGVDTLPEPEGEIEIHPRDSTGFGEIARTMIREYPRRTTLGFTLMTSQAFLYNALFFTYAIALTQFYGVSSGSTGLYLIPFGVGNFLGPLILGRFFDTVGRRPMIAGSYAFAGIGMAITAYLFKQDVLSATSQTVCWVVIFFFASAGASAAYLTVSEVFPMEVRAMAIALFYAIGTAIGGITGPLLFGKLIGTGNRDNLFYGYMAAAVLMLIAAAVELRLGVRAEQKSLEEIAPPLSAETEGDDADAAPERPAHPPARPRHTLGPAATPRFGGRSGTGPGLWVPMQNTGIYGENLVVRPEVDAIVIALEAAPEPLDRRTLATAVGAKFWGPGRFRRALIVAVSEGRVTPAGRGRWKSGGPPAEPRPPSIRGAPTH
jgi:MFS family permease